MSRTGALDLSDVNAWVFDMDDTLYPRSQGVMELIQARINAFVVEAVGLSPDEARVLQKQFLSEHGTTLAGLMANYAVDSERFLREVHDIPLDALEPNPRLAHALKALPGRRFVMTNGARCHADRVLKRIGVTDCFDAVFAIEDMDLTPKPAPATFRRLIERFDIDPRHAVFFEDTPRNLQPAKTLGMRTVLIDETGQAKPDDAIDHVALSLMDFLDALELKDAA